MGLFDFFKKKENEKANNTASQNDSLFSSISKYSEYIVKFIHMHQGGNYAPISAYEKSTGELVGFLYMIGEDASYGYTAEEAVNRMEANFEQKLTSNEIKSYIILYHSQFANDGNHKHATSDDEFRAITAAYHFKTLGSGKLALTYLHDSEGVVYQGFKDFDENENNTIIRVSIKEDKDYFQDRQTIASPVVENAIGLKIKKSNSLDVSNIWCGIFGFESYRKPGGSQILSEYFALALTKGNSLRKKNVTISTLEYSDVNFKGVALNDRPKTILPVIKTDKVVSVSNKDINEWENVENLEAIISGNGKDTFGVWYFATDYAENKESYQTEATLPIKLSGIAFVLDKHDEEYTAYLPSKNLPNYACFDFLGLLLDFKETCLLEDGSLKGYILTVKLITHPEIDDFFTLDMYVTQENMRFHGLSKNMKVSGMFQMQGQIAD